MAVKSFGFVILLLVLCTPIYGASISLLGGEASVAPGGSGGPLTISVISDDASSPPSANLTGWQVAFQLKPDNGSSGLVEFVSAMLDESDYLLDGGNFGLQTSVEGTSLFAFDFQAPFAGGVKVPTDPVGLVDLFFKASGDASGTFGLFVIGGSGGSEWSDNGIQILGRKIGGAPPIQPRDFANFQDGRTSDRIGTVSVPEPRLGGVILMAAYVISCRVGAYRKRVAKSC